MIMEVLFETFESRMLFSAATNLIQGDVAVLRAQANVVRAELNAFRKTALADANLIKADLRRLNTLKADRSLVTTLLQQEQPDLAQARKLANQFLSTIFQDGNRIASDFRQAQRHPTNATLQAKLAADVASLQIELPAAQQGVSAGAALVVSDGTTDLDAIAGANSSDALIQTHVATAKADLSFHVEAIATDVSLLLTEVGTLLLAV
jgi:hypothetical protein